MKSLLLLLLILALVFASSCPDGFDLVRDGECRGLAGVMAVASVEAVDVAISKCDEIQGQPVIIHDEEHQNYWKSHSPSKDEGVMILGLLCNTSSNQWMWADGSDVDFKPELWYEKELDEDCNPDLSWYLDPVLPGYWTSFDGGRGDLSSIFCTTQLEQPAYPGGACQEFVADSDEDECFEFEAVESTWADAQLACENLNASLVSIHGLQENSFVRQLVDGTLNGFFIGARRNDSGSFEWTDGSAMDFDNFFVGFPKSNLGDCLAMDTAQPDGQWMNVDCEEKLPFVCMREPNDNYQPTCSNSEYEEGEIITSPGFPYTASTPCDFFLSVEEGMRVELEIELLEANSCCDSLTIIDGFLGGDVIDQITGFVENATYTTSKSNIMRVSWAPNGGVNVRGVKMTFRAVEAPPTTTMEATTTEIEEETTTTMATTTTKTYVFNQPTEQIFPACPKGFELVKDGECRGLAAIIRATPIDAVERATTTCEQMQARPVIIHDEEHQKYWSDRAPSNDEGFMILALVCNTVTMRYEWADGSEIDYKPYDIWYDRDLDADCKPNVTWYLDAFGNGYWTYGEIEKSHTAFIFCSTQLEQPLYPGGTCQEFENDDDDEACFEIYDEPATWKEAQLACQEQGANLASIHSQQENSFLLQLARFKGVTNGLFVGALSSQGGSFDWMDKSAMDFDNFYPGFPKPNLGDCLSMDTTESAGQWMNVDCSVKLPFACMRQPIENVESTCPNGDFVQGESITSPGFPYSASTPCDFFLSAEIGQKVELEIEALEANSCCDSLTIFDGFLGGEVIAKLTGEVQNVTYTTLTSNIMRVSWQPSGGVNVRGVKMTYRAVGQAQHTTESTIVSTGVSKTHSTVPMGPTSTWSSSSAETTTKTSKHSTISQTSTTGHTTTSEASQKSSLLVLVTSILVCFMTMH